MAELEVAIESLGPMRVAWVQEFGSNPEERAWARLRAWAEPQGLLADPEKHPVFGFNNPAAAAGAREYGYEMWIAADANPCEGVAVKEFPGGRYATAVCLPVSGGAVPQTWKALLRWVHGSQYAWRRATHELEQLMNPGAPPQELVLKLYLPVEG